MNKQASFSVIIPVYNVEKYIARALDSVLSQDYENMEILCMDDASPDKSADIIRKYAARDQRIKLISGDVNVGLGAVRNRGIKLAQNDWILFLDSDDWFEPGLFHKLNDVIKNNPDINIIEFAFNLANEKLNKDSGWLDRGESGLRQSENEDLMLMVGVWNRCWRRSFLIEHNLTNNETRKNAEDITFTVAAMILAGKFYYLNYRGYNYFQNSESITKSGKNNFYSDIINVFLTPLKNDLEKYDVYSDELYHAMIIYMLGWWVPKLHFPRDKKAYKMARAILRSFPHIEKNPTKFAYNRKLYGKIRRMPYCLYRLNMFAKKLKSLWRKVSGHDARKTRRMIKRIGREYPTIMPYDEMISKIRNGASLCRYGDGEFYISMGEKWLDFYTRQSPELTGRLLEVLRYPSDDKLIVAIPSFERIKNENHWVNAYFRHWNRISKLLVNKVYGNAFISRLDYDPTIPLKSLIGIWDNRDVVFVVPQNGRFSYDERLFGNMKSRAEINVPPIHAFDEYDRILLECLTHGKDKLFFICVGPTATVLAYDLAMHGYQALDMGHITAAYLTLVGEAPTPESTDTVKAKN